MNKVILSDSQKKFLRNRLKLTRIWVPVGGGLTAAVVGFWIFAFFRFPLLYNPFHVMARLEARALKPSTLELSALLCPIGFQLCGFLMLMLLLFAWVAMAREKKYQGIIKTLRTGSVDPPAHEPGTTALPSQTGGSMRRPMP